MGMTYYDLNKDEVFYIRHDKCVKAVKYVGTIHNSDAYGRQMCILKVAGEKEPCEIYFPNVKLYPTIDDCRKDINRIPYKEIKWVPLCRQLGLDVVERTHDFHCRLKLYKWDGYYPIQETEDAIKFKFSYLNGEWYIDLKGYYRTFKECEEDNYLKIITF